MRRLASAFVLAALCSASFALGSQPDNGHRMATRGEPPAHDAAHGAMAQPGEIHKKLMAMAGDYDVAVTMSMPGMGEMKSSVQSTISPMLEGRFLRFVEKGEMMGQKFTAEKILGYNSDARQYEALWMYTGSTAMMKLTGMGGAGAGDLGGEGGAITLGATVDGPGGAQAYMITMTVKNADSFEVKMSSADQEGADAGSMVSVYTRKGSGSKATGGLTGGVNKVTDAIEGDEKAAVGTWVIDAEASRPLLNESITAMLKAMGQPVDDEDIKEKVEQSLSQLADLNISLTMNADRTYSASMNGEVADKGTWKRESGTFSLMSQTAGTESTANLKDGKLIMEEGGAKFALKKK